MTAAAIAVQLGITIFSGCAAWLSMDGRKSVRKWAPVVGLVAQPCWFISSWQAGQFGAIAMTVWFTVVWCRGVWNFWFKGM